MDSGLGSADAEPVGAALTRWVFQRELSYRERRVDSGLGGADAEPAWRPLRGRCFWATGPQLPRESHHLGSG